MQIRYGIDLGGTKIEGVALDIATPTPSVLARLRVPTEQQFGYQHILAQIHKVVQLLENETNTKIKKIGIGTPGTIDPTTQKLKNCNTTCLNGQPFQRDLAQKLGIEVATANDANCFAVAEATLGAVRESLPNAQVVFGVIMGTGVGGGVVLNGKVWNGKQGIGGEWGHNFLGNSGGKCYCGRYGCVETLISGPALERFYTARTGEKRTLREIFERLDFDTTAQATKTHLIHYFGKAMANIVNILDPDAIVLGGGVGNISALYTEGVAETAKYVFNNRLETTFLRPKLGDSAGVFGAALL